MRKILTILYHYWQTKRRLRFSRKQLTAWQKKRLEKIRRFACAHSPFYRQNGNKVVCKKDMMAHFSTFNTHGISAQKAYAVAQGGEERRDFQSQIGDLTVGLSSGTSGNRGLFLVSESERLAWCGNILARVLFQPPWKKQKIALFLRANSALYETVRSKTLLFAYFDLLEDPQTLREKLTQFAPDVLIAPPSMLHLLKESCHPKQVVSVAETLFSKDQEELEKAFQQKVHQVYQCTEGFLAFTCPYGTLHLNEDLLFFEKEYLEERHFIPILSDLVRKTQPILRYRLDDVLVERKEPCSCGCVFLALERIEGRCDDVLRVRMSDGKEKSLFPDFVSRKIVSKAPEVESYQVTQTQIDQWEIYLNPPASAAVAEGLGELFDKIGCLHPQLIFTDREFSRPVGSKLRRIRRTYVSE